MKIIDFKFNKTQKIIWSIYFLTLFILFFLKITFSEYRIISPDEIKMLAKGYPISHPWYFTLWSMYLRLAWIPTVILHLIWKDKEGK